MNDIKNEFPPLSSFMLQSTSIDEAHSQIIDRLCFLYSLLQPEKSFAEDVLKPLATATPENPATLTFQTFEDAAHTNHTFGAYLRFLFSSCAFAIHASIADEIGNHNEAWSYIANAHYQLGLLEGLLLLEPSLAYVISARSTSGAKKRAEKFDPLRELARELATKKYYPSKRQAALGIKAEILAEAQKAGIPLSEMQAERTISGWLDGMTFGSKRQP